MAKFIVAYPVGPHVDLTPGTRNADQLVWLQDFARREIDTQDAIAQAHVDVMRFSWQRADFRLADQAGSVRRFDQTALRELQRQLRALFDRLRDPAPGLCWFPESPIRFGVRIHARGRYAVTDSTQSLAGPFFLTVAELLAAIPGPLRTCEAGGCDRLYAAHRPQQRYCSKPCQNRATMARFLGNKGKAPADDRRERRHARVKKKLGAATKVGRKK